MANMDEKLVMGVLIQVKENLKKIDYEELATFMGLGTAKAARCRWDRYKVKLVGKAGGSPITARKAAGTAKKLPQTPSKKTTTRKGGKTNGSTKKKPVKEELSDDEEEDDEDMADFDDADDEETQMDLDTEERKQMETTPSRKLPLRQAAKVPKIKDEASDFEDEEEGMQDDE